MTHTTCGEADKAASCLAEPFIVQLQVCKLGDYGTEWDWREEEAAWQDYPAMEDELEADHAAAMEWFRQARERGENVSGITLQHTPFAASMC